MKKIIKLVVLTLMMLSIIPVSILAEEEIINLKTDLKIVDGKMQFTLSDDYAALSPEFSLNCDIAKPEVIDPNGEAVGSTFDGSTINFLAEVGGTYIISATQGKYLNVEGNIISSNVLSAKDSSDHGVNLTGKNIQIISEPVTLTVQNLNSFKLKNSEGVVLLDIYLTVDNGNTVLNSVVLKDKVEITLDATYEQKPYSDNHKAWVYDVLRIHDGDLEVVTKNLSADKNGKIKFMSDKFSTYAIVAKEQFNGTNSNNNSSSSSSSSSSSTYIAPNTSVR